MAFNFLYSSGTVRSPELIRSRPGFGALPGGGPVRILLVEDDHDFSRMIAHRLSKYKTPIIETAAARTLREALLRLAKEHFDLVLLDLTLPDSRELDTYIKIRSACSRTPVVILSGWGDEAAALEAVQLGAEDFLVKGEIDGKMIPRVIHYALERHRIKEDLAAATQKLNEVNTSLERRTLFDPVTDLYNRRGFQQAHEREIQWAARHGWNLLAMMVDIDSFKKVNSAGGYSVGDTVLKQCAEFFHKTLRTTDHIARIADDKFIVLLPETPVEEGEKIAERVRAGIFQPVQIVPGYPADLTVSVSLVKVFGMTGSTDMLVTRLYSLIRKIKEEGGNRVLTESDPMPDLEDGQQQLDSLLTRMRVADEYYAVKQPIFCLLDSQIVGYEFLSRIRAAECRTPRNFFPLAQENNMLTLVDYNCFQNCAAASAALNHEPGIQYHINLYPSTIAELTVEELMDALPEGIAKDRYCFEISEEQILSDPAYLVRHVRALRQEGIQIALDDVGYGHSSLESLIVLEPDIIKLDARYVHGISQDQDRVRYLERMVKACRELGTRIIAEGVETRLDLNVLISAGVEYGQGFLLGAPS